MAVLIIGKGHACPKSKLFVKTNLTIVFSGFLANKTNIVEMPLMAGNIAEPRLPQTQKYMNHRCLMLGIKRNINAGDLEKNHLK